MSRYFPKLNKALKKLIGEDVIYNDNFNKIEISTDKELPLKKLIYFPNLTVVIRCVFKLGGIFYAQVYLDDGLYQS